MWYVPVYQRYTYSDNITLFLFAKILGARFDYLVDAVERNMKISTIDTKFLDQVTCFDIFNCVWLWYLVDAVEML